jgi:hypothetical protein
MDFEKLINPLRRNDVLIAMGVSSILSAGVGIIGYKQYIKRQSPIYKNDVAIDTMAKELFKNAERWDTERQELHSAFVKEMETMMDDFTRRFTALTNDFERQDKIVVSETEERIGRANVFDNQGDGDGWNFTEELKSRSSDEPYVIHREEFEENEPNHSQSTLTYYAGDDVLVDDQNKPVYNVPHVTGELKFGHGSDDPIICFIRNERLKADYEVYLDQSTYQQEVLGIDTEADLQAELSHSRTPKFRRE